MDEEAKQRFDQMTRAISDKKISRLTSLFQQILTTLPDLYDQQSLKLLFDFLLSQAKTKED